MQKPPVLIAVLGVFAALVAIVPLSYLVLRLIDGYESAAAELLRPRTMELVGNTALLVGSVSITALLLGVFQAWFVVRTNLRFPGFFAVLATIPLAIPSYVLALGYASVFPWFSGFWASWLVLSVATAPYIFLAVSAALMRVDIASEEVARSLGFGRMKVFLLVTWPQIRTSATAAVLLVSLYVLSEFGAIALLRFDTFTRAIYNAYRSSFDRTAAASLALVLVLMTLVIVYFERRYRGDYLLQRAANPRRLRAEIGSTARLVEVALLVAGVLGAGIPLIALTNWTLIGSSTTDVAKLFAATLNSFGIGFAAAVLVSLFALGRGTVDNQAPLEVRQRCGGCALVKSCTTRDCGGPSAGVFWCKCHSLDVSKSLVAADCLPNFVFAQRPSGNGDTAVSGAKIGC